jgi:hypothetical protein
MQAQISTANKKIAHPSSTYPDQNSRRSSSGLNQGNNAELETKQPKVLALVLLEQESKQTGIPLEQVMRKHGYAWDGKNGLKNPIEIKIEPRQFNTLPVNKSNSQVVDEQQFNNPKSVVTLQKSMIFESNFDALSRYLVLATSPAYLKAVEKEYTVGFSEVFEESKKRLLKLLNLDFQINEEPTYSDYLNRKSKHIQALTPHAKLVLKQHGYEIAGNSAKGMDSYLISLIQAATGDLKTDHAQRAKAISERMSKELQYEKLPIKTFDILQSEWSKRAIEHVNDACKVNLNVRISQPETQGVIVLQGFETKENNFGRPTKNVDLLHSINKFEYMHKK